ncbi:MAG: hypothetical protein ACXVQ2_12690 [Actinomycetota bacterium]
MEKHGRAGIDAVDWVDAVDSLIEKGWVRLEGAVDARTCSNLGHAAPATWERLPRVEGDVHQCGLRSGVFFDSAAPVVQQFGRTICGSLSAARSDIVAVPCFNDVQWGQSHDGVGYITAHRDPPAAGGIIAIVTLHGRARFRVRHGMSASEWDTADGDLVLLRGNGWPERNALCPVHEDESRGDDRMTMTLRHNTGGPGADYFA